MISAILRTREPILALVESDAAVRDALKFSLGIDGFDVRLYASSEEFLNDNNAPAFICLIVHYTLPGMNGLDLIATLRKRGNRMPAVLITGRSISSIRTKASAAGIPIVEKPFLETELADVIRKLLK